MSHKRHKGEHKKHKKRFFCAFCVPSLISLAKPLLAQSLDPANDRVQRDCERLCIATFPFQGMIASFDPFQCRIRADLADNRCKQCWLGKRILRSAHEEHWNEEPIHVLISELIRLTRRMQRITEKEQSTNFRYIRSDIGRNSPTH